MALDFLGNTTPASSDSSVINGSGGSDIIGTISKLLNLGGQGLQLANTAQGYQPTAAEGQQAQAMSNQQALLAAMLDPNSTVYKNAVAGQQQQLNNQTQQGLQSLLQMNRKAQLMGRQTYFNPERQDEAVSQYLGNQATNNATTARSNALNQIISAANGYGNSANAYGGMIKNQQVAQAQNKSALPTALNQAGGALSQFGTGGSLSNLLPGLASAGSSLMDTIGSFF